MNAPFALDGLDDVAMDHDLSGALETQCKTTSPPSAKGQSPSGGLSKRQPLADNGEEEEEVRVFAVSDVHIESPENQHWVQTLSDTAYQRDALIVAGDITDDLRMLEVTLTVLVSKFHTVFFTPGNHDLWVSRDDVAAGVPDSLTKIHAVLAMCERIGVATAPRRIGTLASGVRVAPLLSFHHQSFDTEPDLQGWNVPAAEQCMSDYRNCFFCPPLNMIDESVAQAVDQLNDSILSGAAQVLSLHEPLITFSHFLPRIELLPEKRFLLCPPLAKASGSAFLHARVRALRPTLHVFGHSHFGWDATLEGVRYVQAALAYPTERRSRWHTLKVGDFGPDGPLLLWSSVGGFAPARHCRWSGYYERHQREPQRVFELASYAASQFQRTDDRATEVMPDFRHEDGVNVKAGARMLTYDPAIVHPPAGFS